MEVFWHMQRGLSHELKGEIETRAAAAAYTGYTNTKRQRSDPMHACMYACLVVSGGGEAVSLHDDHAQLVLQRAVG